jgi:hypothetical protein
LTRYVFIYALTIYQSGGHVILSLEHVIHVHRSYRVATHFTPCTQVIAIVQKKDFPCLLNATVLFYHLWKKNEGEVTRTFINRVFEFGWYFSLSIVYK